MISNFLTYLAKFVDFLSIKNLFLFFIIGIILKLVALYPKDIYAKHYKSTIISPYLKSIYTNFSYFPKKSLLKNDYLTKCENANFFNDKYNSSTLTDFIAGTFKNRIFFELCYIELKYTPYRGITKCKFNGFFCETHIDRDFGPYTKISLNSNITDTSINNYYELFEIFYSDESLTSKFLINNILIEASKFYKETQLKFEIVFNRNLLLFRFHIDNIFDPYIYSKSLEKDKLYSNLYLFNLIIKFIRKISLIQN